jgi:hypothetical protein
VDHNQKKPNSIPYHSLIISANPAQWICKVLSFMYNRELQFYTFFWNFNRNKRRLIDNGKKITFYFLQNVCKCTDFFAFAFKVCKKCYYDPKKIFSKNINMGIKKRIILCWFQIRWCRLSEMPLKKLKAKNHEKMHKNENTSNSHRFLALAFFRGICLSRHQRIWNQHKILRLTTL